MSDVECDYDIEEMQEAGIDGVDYVWDQAEEGVKWILIEAIVLARGGWGMGKRWWMCRKQSSFHHHQSPMKLLSPAVYLTYAHAHFPVHTESSLR